MTIEQKLESLKFETVLIREPLRVKSDNWQETAHKWLIRINGQEFDYYTGFAHREALRRLWSEQRAEYKRLSGANLTEHGLQQLLHLSKAKPPTVKDVLYSLVMDAGAQEESFSDWCDNFGYDTDSRKALETYLACQENAVKLRKLNIAPLSELQEFFSDY